MRDEFANRTTQPDKILGYPNQRRVSVSRFIPPIPLNQIQSRKTTQRHQKNTDHRSLDPLLNQHHGIGIVHQGFCCFRISKLLYLDFQIILSTEAVTRLSHDQISLLKTLRGTSQNCAYMTINHVA